MNDPTLHLCLVNLKKKQKNYVNKAAEDTLNWINTELRDVLKCQQNSYNVPLYELQLSNIKSRADGTLMQMHH